MKIKFKYSGRSCHFLITTSKRAEISIEIFGESFIRNILKKQMQPFYKEGGRTNNHTAKGSGRKQIEFVTNIRRRYFNISLRITTKKLVSKAVYRKWRKKMWKLVYEGRGRCR